ncbi:MotA/TolQ/ExbB proton channel family protein [Roseateles asaccharophilus]|uniref:Biopolymer transport protein ExbB/TolQ n=1 Tax=Roseateles asaccharophilus TaxID=582607 RepID=A0ABU2A944_9BURK|nr:MotA/TolQ/ExbB proton channel family protein [Roseateles asaccharophilus]MDR7333684.1 biopolymer transport protein ExbB/TolQ [Roseateles asaccharophilus]
MMLEQGFAHIAQALLWPVLILVTCSFVYSLWVAGATLMEALQRRKPGYRALAGHQDKADEEIELHVLHQLEPLRLLGRVSPLLGLIATMVPLGPALQSVAAGQGQQALAVFSSAFAGVVLALAAAAIGLVAYSFKRRWLMAELVSIRATRGAV